MTYRLTPTQQHRSQLNGAASRRNFNGFGIKTDHGPKILNLLRTGEKSITEISERLHLQYFNTQKHLLRLVDSGQAEAVPAVKGRKGKYFRVAGVHAASAAPRRYQYQWQDLGRDLRAHQRLAESVRR